MNSFLQFTFYASLIYTFVSEFTGISWSQTANITLRQELDRNRFSSRTLGTPNFYDDHANSTSQFNVINREPQIKLLDGLLPTISAPCVWLWNHSWYILKQHSIFLGIYKRPWHPVPSKRHQEPNCLHPFVTTSNHSGLSALRLHTQSRVHLLSCDSPSNGCSLITIILQIQRQQNTSLISTLVINFRYNDTPLRTTSVHYPNQRGMLWLKSLTGIQFNGIGCQRTICPKQRRLGK
jgi:hypothetical protein